MAVIAGLSWLTMLVASLYQPFVAVAQVRLPPEHCALHSRRRRRGIDLRDNASVERLLLRVDSWSGGGGNRDCVVSMDYGF
jgi:hypothetical protein